MPKTATGSSTQDHRPVCDPVLKVKLRGPGVKSGRISVPDLIKICEEAQNAVKRQAEALEGRRTGHPGPVSATILAECTLDLIGVEKGSTVLLFGFAKPQMSIPQYDSLGKRAVSELAYSIRSLEDDNHREIDPGVLRSVYNLGALAESPDIAELKFIVPQDRGRALEATVSQEVRRRAASRLSSPLYGAAEVDGRLEMADFDARGQKCRIEPAIGTSVLCTFDPELANAVQQLLRTTVRGSGTARLSADTGRIETLHLQKLTALPSLSLGKNDFFSSYSVQELADMQNVKPFKDIESLAGAIPDDVDLDAFLDTIYSCRK